MDMIKSIIRIAILISLFAAAYVLIVSEPAADDARWFYDFCISKSVGAICVWLLTKLYPRWSKTDKWIARYDAWCKKGVEQDI